MAYHDHGYKLLFAHPALVEDLLTGFVKEGWVARLDFSTLERVAGSYISDDLREREDDIIWRVRFGDKSGNMSGDKGWLYVYLLMEFQSTVDRFMAVRMMTYLGLLYQDLIRQKALTPSGRLFPVLPIVLYNGETRWHAAEDIADLIEPVPGGLERYRPQLSYLLLDEGAMVASEASMDEPDALRNTAVALFRLEHHRDEQDMLAVLGSLVKWLQAPEQTSLRRAFAVWINRVLLPHRAPDTDLPEINELHEVHKMLSERVKKWPDRWIAKGVEQGLEQGRAEAAQAARAAARKLIAQVMLSDQQIAEALGLPVEEVRRLRSENGADKA
ncbi:MAG: Rpn family recombination-promoting nuclease/putative transposase [Parahaliea sp.]